MKRKDFLKTGIAGLAGLHIGKAALAAQPTINKTEEEASLGYNHLPNKEEIMKDAVLHRANTRGHADHGWLNTYHTFSFANYRNPERMNFGVLRVLNDDTVAPGRGFGTHPHDNMEIISIPLEGDLEHKDSMGNTAVIKQGDVQVMSAGTGIFHSEYNRNKDKLVKFLQIWMFPNKRDVTPRYDQITLDESERHNKWQQIISPNPDDEGMWTHQNAWFHISNMDAGQELELPVQDKNNGVYFFMIKGSANIEGFELSQRDGFGAWNRNIFKTKALEDAEILAMEVPMEM